MELSTIGQENPILLVKPDISILDNINAGRKWEDSDERTLDQSGYYKSPGSSLKSTFIYRIPNILHDITQSHESA